MDKWKYNEDRIRNEKIRLKIGVAPIDEKMRESCLRWFDKGERLMHQRVDSSRGNEKNVEEDQK